MSRIADDCTWRWTYWIYSWPALTRPGALWNTSCFISRCEPRTDSEYIEKSKKRRRKTAEEFLCTTATFATSLWPLLKKFCVWNRPRLWCCPDTPRRTWSCEATRSRKALKSSPTSTRPWGSRWASRIRTFLTRRDSSMNGENSRLRRGCLLFRPDRDIAPESRWPGQNYSCSWPLSCK